MGEDWHTKIKILAHRYRNENLGVSIDVAALNFRQTSH